jgi:hypothetical protein
MRRLKLARVVNCQIEEEEDKDVKVGCNILYKMVC